MKKIYTILLTLLITNALFAQVFNFGPFVSTTSNPAYVVEPVIEIVGIKITAGGGGSTSLNFLPVFKVTNSVSGTNGAYDNATFWNYEFTVKSKNSQLQSSSTGAAINWYTNVKSDVKEGIEGYNGTALLSLSELSAIVGVTLQVGQVYSQKTVLDWFAYNEAQINIAYTGLSGNRTVNATPSTPGGGDDPLPVRIASLGAEAVTTGNKIFWSTATEINNKGFSVERSNGNNNWQELAFVATKANHGNSTAIIRYEYTDAAFLNGNNYYRLKQVDIDGTITYSAVVTVNNVTTIQKQPYPNPASNILTVPVSSSAAQVIMYNVAGAIVPLGTAGRTANGITLNVSSLPVGYYWVQVVENGNKQAYKVLIAK